MSSPIELLKRWLSQQPTENLWTVILLCGIGVYLVLLYVLVSGFDSGFRIRRSRRWWK